MGTVSLLDTTLPPDLPYFHCKIETFFNTHYKKLQLFVGGTFFFGVSLYEQPFIRTLIKNLIKASHLGPGFFYPNILTNGSKD